MDREEKIHEMMEDLEYGILDVLNSTDKEFLDNGMNDFTVSAIEEIVDQEDELHLSAHIGDSIHIDYNDYTFEIYYDRDLMAFQLKLVG